MAFRQASAAAALVVVGSFALAGCAPSTFELDDSKSVAVVEEFFAHLEAGESEAAAALTTMEFSADLVDDNFYASSVAVPSKAHIVDTVGFDGNSFTATVEYVLGDEHTPQSMFVRVDGDADEVKITGWQGDSPIRLGLHTSPGTVTINDAYTVTVTEPDTELLLLPGTYSFEYQDMTGLREVASSYQAEFSYSVPTDDIFPLMTTYRPDVSPAIREEVNRMIDVCVEEGFAGSTCPQGLSDALEMLPQPDAPEDVEWFRHSGPDITWDGTEHVATMTFYLWHRPIRTEPTVMFTGLVERAADGTVTFTP